MLIFRDANRDRKRGSAGYYVSMVGLGFLLECLTIAASGEGLAAGIAPRYDLEHSDEPWAEVTFEPTDSEPDALLDRLALRCSDRRLYQGGDLSDEVFHQVLDDSDRADDCRLYFQGQPDDRLIDYILSCEEFVWTDKHILPEMLSWVRWHRREVERSRDGMPWQAMGVSYLISRLMRWVANSPRFRRVARRSGGPLRAQKRNLEAQIRSPAALGCFAIRDTRPEAMLQVGRAFLRAWVWLNMAGYGVQVMANSSSLHVLQYVAGVLPDDYPEASKGVFATGRSELTAAFGCDEAEIQSLIFNR